MYSPATRGSAQGYLYTLIMTDKTKAEKLKQSLGVPKSLQACLLLITCGACILSWHKTSHVG